MLCRELIAVLYEVNCYRSRQIWGPSRSEFNKLQGIYAAYQQVDLVRASKLGVHKAAAPKSWRSIEYYNSPRDQTTPAHTFRAMNETYLNSTPAQEPPNGVLPNFDNPANVSGSMKLVTYLGLSLSWIFMVLRVWTRVAIQKRFTWEDCKSLLLIIRSPNILIMILIVLKIQ